MELEFMKNQLEAWESAGLILKWEKDVEWLSSVTFPPKKGGDLRFCCTYVALNKATVPDSYPLPRVDEVLEDLAGYPLYTTVDGFSGYYAMGLDPESVPLTAFLTPFGIYVWLVLPFGLRNAPPRYSRLVARAYGGLERTRTFVDDGGIGHTGEGSIVRDLRAFLNRSREFKLKLKPQKIFIGFKQLEFVGHNLFIDGLAVLNSKIEKVENLEIPSTKTQLRSFLGMTGYCRRFVKNFGQIAKPLTELLKATPEQRGAELVGWGDAHHHAFT